MKIITIILAMLLFLLAACAPAEVGEGESSGGVPEAETADVPPASGDEAPASGGEAPAEVGGARRETSIVKIDFASHFSLSEEQRLEVLDADGESVLYSVTESRRFDGDDANAYWTTVELGVFDTARSEKAVLDAAPGGYCLTGALNDAGTAFVCSFDAFSQECGILMFSDKSSKALDSFVSYDLYAPEFCKLDDGSVLYSFYDLTDEAGARFGIKRADADGRVSVPAQWTETEGVSMQGMNISSDGKNFAFFAEDEGEGRFYVGTKDGIAAHFPLDVGERIYSFAMLPDGVFVSLVRDGQYSWEVRALSGETLYSASEESASEDYWVGNLFRLRTNGGSMLAGTNGFFQSCVVTAEDGVISALPLNADEALGVEADGSAVIFRCADENSFYLYYQQYAALARATIS